MRWVWIVVVAALHWAISIGLGLANAISLTACSIAEQQYPESLVESLSCFMLDVTWRVSRLFFWPISVAVFDNGLPDSAPGVIVDSSCWWATVLNSLLWAIAIVLLFSWLTARRRGRNDTA